MTGEFFDQWILLSVSPLDKKWPLLQLLFSDIWTAILMTGGAQGGLNLLHVTCYPMIQKCEVGGKLGKLENLGNKGKLDILGLFSTRWVIDLHKIFFSKKEKKMSPGVIVDGKKK